MSALAPARRLAPPQVKAAARAAIGRYGLLTAEHRPLPDYLVIGTKRGGTTSLWKNLRLHPQVLSLFPQAGNLKSPHFFDINWARGERWYRSHFPTDRHRERQAREAGHPVVVGDVSPYYLFHPRAAERASLVVPEAKIVVALRNPVDRAYSHYQERCKAGTEHASFAEALAAEPERLAAEVPRMAADPDYYSEAHDFCSYLARGRYLEQLQPWLDRYPPSSVLVLASERYYGEPAAALREVFELLGVDPEFPIPATEHMNYLPAAPMDPAIREQLNAYYRPHVQALQEALGRDFGWDLSSVRQGG